MALNLLDIPVLNPLRFTKVGYSNPVSYNTRYMDDWHYSDRIRSFEEPSQWYQPWQKNDIIYLQIMSNYLPHQIEMYRSCDDALIDTFLFTYVATSIEGIGVKVHEASIALTDYEEGYYYFKIKSGDPLLETYISNVIDLKVLHPETVLYSYAHDENDHGVAFETGIRFNYRCYGGFIEGDGFQPGSDRVVFIDQTRNATQLSGKSFYIETLFIGDAFGVPKEEIWRINNIFLCADAQIDGKQWVANDGESPEGKREDFYPLVGYKWNLRPAQNKMYKRFEVEGSVGGESSVTYNIETVGFGPETGPGSSNVIKILSTD